MVIVFQILFILFALFALFSVIKKKEAGLLTTGAVIFWVVFWIVAIGVVLWPKSTSMLAEYVGIGRGVDVVVYASLALIFFLVFKIHIKLETLNKDITKIVRWEALEENKKEDNL